MTLHLKSIILAFSMILLHGEALFLTPEEFKVKILKNWIIIPDFDISNISEPIAIDLGRPRKTTWSSGSEDFHGKRFGDFRISWNGVRSVSNIIQSNFKHTLNKNHLGLFIFFIVSVV